MRSRLSLTFFGFAHLTDELGIGKTRTKESHSVERHNREIEGRQDKSLAMASQAVQTTLKVDVTESEQIEANRSPDSPPLASAYNIRRSLSPLLDFGRPGSSLGGERRNFCNISECAFCKPLTDNHRLLSPLRSPVISPSSRFQIPFLFSLQSKKILW